MKVFVAGATGALGRPLVRRLIQAGHEVVGLTSRRPEIVQELGAKPAVADAFDADALRIAVEDASPDAVVHALSRVPHAIIPNPRRLRENNLLRTRGTRHLIEASRAAEVSKLVAASITFAFRGRSEENMNPLMGLGSFQEGVDAVVDLEQQVLEYEGIVLRFGLFYGSGTVINEKYPKALKWRALPILGKGTGWWSFIHVDDAASAVVAALHQGRPAETYNICDDEPILARDALRIIAETVGAPRPLQVPALAPYPARQHFNQATGASNLKARQQLQWVPTHPSFAVGFPATYEKTA